MTNPEGEYVRARLGMDYILNEEEASLYTLRLLEAGERYADTIPPEAEFEFYPKKTDNFLFVVFARNAFRAVTWTEAGEQLDDMKARIEHLAGFSGNEASLEDIFGGFSIVGMSPKAAPTHV